MQVGKKQSQIAGKGKMKINSRAITLHVQLKLLTTARSKPNNLCKNFQFKTEAFCQRNNSPILQKTNVGSSVYKGLPSCQNWSRLDKRQSGETQQYSVLRKGMKA